MNDWKHLNDMTGDEGIARRERLRADLAAVRRTAELIAEAKRQDRERADILEDRRLQRQLDRRDKHELKAAEYRLGDMTFDPDAWAWSLTSARAGDAYLAVLLAGDRWDDGEALDQLETEILDRYGIDLHDIPTADRDHKALQRDDDVVQQGRSAATAELTSRSEDAFQEGKDEGRAEVRAAVEAAIREHEFDLDGMDYVEVLALKPALVDGDTSALERVRQADREQIARRIEDDADPAFADEYAALEWAARVARDDGSDAEAGDDVAAADVSVPEAQVQLALDHLRSCNDEAPARPYATGHYLLTDDQWQTAIDELRRRGHVISEYTWVGAEDIDTVEGDHCYHLDEDTAAPTADERRGRFERKERVNRVHFDWANAHPGGDFWASAEAAAIEFDHDPAGGSDRAQATATPSRYVFTSGAPAEDCPGCGGDTVIGSPAQHEWNDRVQAALATWRANHDGDEEIWWATDDAAALFDQAHVDEETTCPDCHGSGLVGVHVDEDGSLVDAGGEPVFAVVPVEYRQDPTGVDAADTKPGPPPGLATDPDTTDTPDPKAAAREPDTEPIEHADDEANDASLATADVDQVGDDASSPVDRAQRAVLELKGRRALEEQYARDREDDDASLDRAFYKAAADVDAWGRPGPVLSAFDD